MKPDKAMGSKITVPWTLVTDHDVYQKHSFAARLPQIAVFDHRVARHRPRHCLQWYSDSCRNPDKVSKGYQDIRQIG